MDPVGQGLPPPLKPQGRAKVPRNAQSLQAMAVKLDGQISALNALLQSDGLGAPSTMSSSTPGLVNVAAFGSAATPHEPSSSTLSSVNLLPLPSHAKNVTPLLSTLSSGWWSQMSNFLNTDQGQSIVTGPPNARALKRIHRDIAALTEEPVEGIYAVPDDANVSMVHALICGPTDTPYEGGFFYFVVYYPPDYPIKNPSVKLMTTGNGTVRFNPNLYNNGKVCLSILGTWEGPSWTPSYDTRSVLLSIQSLMCEEPFYNEPGYERMNKNGTKASSDRYNLVIRFNALKVAGLDMYEDKNADTKKMPEALKKIVRTEFEKNIEFYKKAISKGEPFDNKVSGRAQLQYLLPNSSQTINYPELAKRLTDIENKIPQPKSTVVLVLPSSTSTCSSPSKRTIIDIVDLDSDSDEIKLVAKRVRTGTLSTVATSSEQDADDDIICID